MSLRSSPPRPTLHRVAPAYPRVLAVGAILLAGCGGIVEKDASKSTQPAQTQADAAQLPFLDGGGTVTTPYDAGAPDEGIDTAAPDPAGDIAYPYTDSGPTPVTTAPPTSDGGIDDTDPSSAGGAPAPFDGGTATAAPSDPAPFDGGTAPSL